MRFIVFADDYAPAVDIVHYNVCRECDDGDAKPRKETAEHGTIAENRVFTPCLSFRPGITKKREIRHRGVSLLCYCLRYTWIDELYQHQCDHVNFTTD